MNGMIRGCAQNHRVVAELSQIANAATSVAVIVVATAATHRIPAQAVHRPTQVQNLAEVQVQTTDGATIAAHTKLRHLDDISATLDFVLLVPDEPGVLPAFIVLQFPSDVDILPRLHFQIRGQHTAQPAGRGEFPHR